MHVLIDQARRPLSAILACTLPKWVEYYFCWNFPTLPQARWEARTIGGRSQSGDWWNRWHHQKPRPPQKTLKWEIFSSFLKLCSAGKHCTSRWGQSRFNLTECNLNCFTPPFFCSWKKVWSRVRACPSPHHPREESKVEERLEFEVSRCPEQLNRWPCHSVTESVRVLLLLTYKERPWRPLTFETFDHTDEKTWTGQKIPTCLHTYPLTYIPTYLPTYVPPPTHPPTNLPPLENTLMERSWGLATFETVITILTIENLDRSQSLLPDN